MARKRSRSFCQRCRWQVTPNTHTSLTQRSLSELTILPRQCGLTIFSFSFSLSLSGDHAFQIALDPILSDSCPSELMCDTFFSMEPGSKSIVSLYTLGKALGLYIGSMVYKVGNAKSGENVPNGKQGLSPCAAKYPPSPRCVPSDSVSQSATVSICHFVVLGLVIMNST